MLPRTLEPEVMDTPEEARDYDEMDHREVNRQFVADFLAAVRVRIPPDRSDTAAWRVLDVGTGTAQIPIQLCRTVPVGEVVAIDLAAEMLRVAKLNVRRAKLRGVIRPEQVDAKQMPWEAGTFDAVISNSIIHHIPQPEQVWREMLRVLRPAGLLFVRDLLRPATEAEVERLVATWAGDANAHQQALFRASLHAALTLDEVRGMIGGLGLPVEAVRQTSDRHWTVCATAHAG